MPGDLEKMHLCLHILPQEYDMQQLAPAWRMLSLESQNLKYFPKSSPQTQAREKSPKINFLGPETARWGGGLPLEGVVAKNFVPALESLSSLGFEERNLGCPGNFAGMSRTPGGVQKVCAKKLRAHFSFPTDR